MLNIYFVSLHCRTEFGQLQFVVELVNELHVFIFF